MKGDEAQIGLERLELNQRPLARVEAKGVDALLGQSPAHGLAAVERHVALGGDAAHQNGHFAVLFGVDGAEARGLRRDGGAHAASLSPPNAPSGATPSGSLAKENSADGTRPTLPAPIVIATSPSRSAAYSFPGASATSPA